MGKSVDKALILALIKDDLINSKLIYGLSSIGINATNYHLYLSTTIFNLMGFKDDHYRGEVFALYLELSKKAMQINISERPIAFDALALEIFQMLHEKNFPPR
jgi:hypothetical protein